MRETLPPSSAAVLAGSLAKLWPHREHESNCFKALLCSLGGHRWAQLPLGRLARAEKQVRFCRWCPKVKVDGAVHGD